MEEMEAYAAGAEVPGGGKDDKVSFCPLLYTHSGISLYCKKENCAWWNDDDEECAVLTLGRAFSKHYLEVMTR